MSHPASGPNFQIFTIVLDEVSAGRNLSAVLKDRLASGAGSQLQIRRDASVVTAQLSHMSIALHDGLPIRVAGRDAYAVLADIKVTVDDTNPLRAAFVAVPAAAPLVLPSARGPHAFSALHVVSLYSRTRDFDVELKDFQQLLARISFSHGG